ncbi:alpha-L-rhamnosidase-like protein [Dysgonomonas alginatilytica]|uniref:Alpha-L-rhamnosidase-like protein n=1 Tax=Dysgonomonas alginatilytica TaxID=1605892 RepID=A0A2V3PKM4_9BACT|nr:glycosyl hydrolase [Dysgonomonas alginatilytica]PXV59947.1 alpha-L-rhamnosidase-like protein [Dysgonomonas alginatilytica]
MKRTALNIALALIVSSCPAVESIAQVGSDLFLNPPKEVQPWVYWMWVNGNISKEGVQKDLEAMHRAGINGAIALDVDQDSPNGPVVYNDKNWQEIFHHSAITAQRLGMEIGGNNGAGYWGTGGPWVKPELAMQWVVSSETYIHGGKQWNGKLKSPGLGDDYRDIAVIAVGVIDTVAEKRYIIPDFPLKSSQNPGNAGPVRYSCAPFTYKELQWPGFPRYLMYRGTQSASLKETAPKEAIIQQNKVINLTAKMQKDGTLSWDVPAGEWTIIRFGHQWTGSSIGPVTYKVIGPETDKLSKEATRFHFDEMVKKLKSYAVSEAFTTVHIDSWEGGGQNWTPGFDQIFKERRGYDILPWLPVLTGRVINSLQETERFMYDLRQTISELFVENYVKEFQQLAHKEGLKLSYESYTTPANDMDVVQYVDIPMAEFWIPVGWHPNFDPTIKSMASAAHLNGTTIVAAEALTSSGSERWQWHPATMKPLVDEAFSGGVNRLVFHRFSSQYFDVEGPGIQMNRWGSKYERTNTWWEFSTAWHTYISRCQYMLQKGIFYADVLALQSEEPWQRFAGLALDGYDYDVIGQDAFKKVEMNDNGLYFPNRPAYKLLLLPDSETMTVAMLTHIRNLVCNGAVVLGNRPKSVPGLLNYREEEKKLGILVGELWGTGDYITKENRLGKGTVYSDMTVEEALLRMGIPRDFTADYWLKYIHRTIDNEECYFLANTSDKEFTATCTFRVDGKKAELWDAETGEKYRIDISANVGGTTTLRIPFNAAKSWFVIFRPSADASLPLFNPKQEQQNETAINNNWVLYFPKGSGTPLKVELPRLVSWSEHTDPEIKYFSGTARYEKIITIDDKMLRDRLPVILDLGKVEIMARVKLNGKDLGIAWRAPYSFDITEAAKAGENRLEIEVVNLWPNRLIGDEQLADDVGYNKEGTMKEWPEWLLKGKKRPSKRKVFSARKQWNADDKLISSGLLGPVMIFNRSE